MPAHRPTVLPSSILSAVSGIVIKTLRKAYVVLKHFIDPFMSTQSKASIFKIPSLSSWKLANYNRSLLETCLRNQCWCSKALAPCPNLSVQSYGVLGMKIGFLGGDSAALDIILTFKSKDTTSILAHPVGHKDNNQFYFLWYIHSKLPLPLFASSCRGCAPNYLVWLIPGYCACSCTYNTTLQWENNPGLFKQRGEQKRAQHQD